MSTLILSLLLSASPARPHLTLDQVVAPAAVTGTSPTSPVWSPDGQRLAFLWDDRGRARSVWLVGRDGEGLRRLTGEVGTAPPRAVSELAWTPDDAALVTLEAGDLWLTPASGGEPRRLTSSGGDKATLAVSPDGRLASFLQEGDLWTVPLSGGEPRRLTSVGVPGIAPSAQGTYARPDVEIGPGVWTGPDVPYRWSPDGRRVAVHVVDRRQVRRVGFPTYLGGEASMEVVRRAAPGDRNEERRVGLVDAGTGALTYLELSDPSSMAVLTLAWSPSGVLLVDRVSDDQVERRVHLLHASGAPRQVWSDRREGRIYTDLASAWHPDGHRLLLTTDLDDRYRISVLVPGESELQPITPPGFDVAGAAIPVPATGDILYVSAEPLPAERQVWRLPGGEGTRVRLTRRGGYHVPFPSPDGAVVAFLSSDDVNPPELWIGERRITRSPPAGAPAWVRPRYVTLRARDGRTLHARILEPPGLAAGARCPTVFGPIYTNTVRNRWGGLWGLLQQYLALEKGYRVVQVDVRGSTGYGRAFREAFLLDYGGGDLDDLEDAVRWLSRQPGVDPARMGVFGSSYGGTVAVYSLFKKPGLFAAGVAGAPATDPRWFGSDDVAITRTPAGHPEAFERGQARRYAGGLRDPLLIIHGMADDVVPFKTTVDLVEHLASLGKDFELAIGPRSTHAWTRGPDARFLLGKLVGHLERHLGRRARQPSPEVKLER